MSSINPTLNCPCAGAYLREAFVYTKPPAGETRFDLKGQPYWRAYDRCELCGHFFSRHDLDLSELYRADYVDATYGGVKGMRERLENIRALPPERSDNTARVQRIMRFLKHHPVQGRRLLDIGAGIGVFPAAMKERGWEVTAVEPDRRTAEHLLTQVGVKAFADDLFDLEPEHLGYFDILTFNKVLEHVESPVDVLATATRFLAEGGFIYVELPDVAAAVQGSGREEFFIEHHHVFNPTSLAILAERASLTLTLLKRFREPSEKYSLGGFMVFNPSPAGGAA